MMTFFGGADEYYSSSTTESDDYETEYPLKEHGNLWNL